MILLFTAIFLIQFVSISSAAGFVINPEIIKTSIKENEKTSYEISLANNYDEQREFLINLNPKKSFLSLDKEKIYLQKSETGIFNVFFDSNGLGTGIFVGNILVNSEQDSKRILFILESESEKPNFDVVIDISPEFSELSYGEEFSANVKVYNLRAKEDEVYLKYFILNAEGNQVFSEEFRTEVTSQAEFTKILDLPSELDEGEYVFAVYAVSGGTTGLSSKIFTLSDEVKLSPESGKSKYLNFAFFIIIVLIVAFLILNHYWEKNLKTTAKEWNSRIEEIRKYKFGDVGKKIQKLNYQERLLEQAYNRGYVKKASYEAGKRKIHILLSDLRKRL